MTQSNSNAETFDVFLCHNGEDKEEIRKIADNLENQGVNPWLDEREIRPGTSWQTALGEQIENIKSAAVFVGESGLGPWQNQEIQALLSQFVKRNCPVIPVVLPSAKSTPELPWTLENLHYVDFRATNPDPLKQLMWGITGEKPSDKSTSSSSTDDSQVEEQDLLPPKDRQVIEIRLPGNLDSFSTDAKEKLLRSLSDLLEIGDVKLTQEALPGSIRLHLELKPEDADKVYAALKQGRLTELGITEARLYPAIAVPPDEEQHSQLLILLDRVREHWVEGVLRNSLHHEVLISLGKRSMDEAVDPPWKHTVELPSQRRHLLLQDRNISTVFDATGLLLILGEPGSGKTTTLLELASDLIGRAKGDPKERVPIVLNLSSWQKKQPLVEWIAGELSAKYRVPISIARSWLKSDYLLLLLDGLDEVQTTSQPDCVAAINEFIDKFEPAGLVVCCRLMEYQWLPERLKLNGAICLESLSSEEVNEFLAGGGAQLAGLQQALSTDPVLQELSQTPLMLSIMSLAYEGGGGDELAERTANSPEDRRKQIFSLYVERMFQRKESAALPFPKEKLIGWLSWLAKNMNERSQSVFMIEGLQPSWLSSIGQQVSFTVLVALTIGLIVGPARRRAARRVEQRAERSADHRADHRAERRTGYSPGLLVGIAPGEWRLWADSSGLISGLISGLLAEELIVGLIAGLPAGLLGGLLGGVGVGSLNCIPLVETMSWKWREFWKKTLPGSILGLIVGLSSGLILFFILARLPFHGRQSGELITGLIGGGLMFGLGGGLIGFLISGLIGGMTDTVKADKASPNQGIKLSGKNAAIAFVTGGLIFGLIFGLITGLSAGLPAGLIFGLIFGLIGGLNRGGSGVAKHYSLRLILWLKGYTPFKFIKLLDHSAKLILLKKVGGGYMFMHRMLLEYFAELNSKGMGRGRPASEALELFNPPE